MRALMFPFSFFVSFVLIALSLRPSFSDSISNYSLLLLSCISVYVCSLMSSLGLKSLLSLKVQQLDITIFELRFLSFRSTSSADLALKGRLLSQVLRPERYTYIFSLAPFSSFPSYQLAIILRPSFPSSPSQPA